ncbi:V-type proton ATPase subunit d [Neolecta irregularis DAH-3]|uniref:V-type proton ATPase subunit n=1 Tax=Neolecta irregularis (strain DAH-3) TaxID=1198029 RepID=A0A1U7LK17_NEOID|nr:V-type proton ATPase subunit d [Neolecta irregularis DAH-3]|eukprot:OLL23000.1 V-type proton ATPase subunit d [Neolecta irregularis DAH-3]
MEGLYFNVDNGYLEGVVRGYRSGLVDSTVYHNLTQCDSLQDIKMQLATTDYANFLGQEQVLSTSCIGEKATEKMVNEFKYLKLNASYEMNRFLDYITYSYMIDNVILLITGTLHERDTHELLDRCHPLGKFETMPALCVATSVEELYNAVLVETPLDCLVAADLDDLHIEIIRNTLYKSYLEDFHRFVQTLPSPTGEIMGEILEFEADRRAINITLNSFGTDLSREDRQKLYPRVGMLYPEGSFMLSRAEDVEGVKGAVAGVVEYRRFFEQGNKSLEDWFFEREVELNKNAFLSQVGIGIAGALTAVSLRDCLCVGAIEGAGDPEHCVDSRVCRAVSSRASIADRRNQKGRINSYICI